ncbi:beta-lactamase/transpeptidase-like protein [Hypomontagnella submonticulosa]|nr:beta-lactamase/transpeptidase-like protein [Hypomontagnella submonticulosa]
MANFSHEAIFEAACQAGEIPGAVLAAADASGKFTYQKAFGKTAHGEPYKLDSVMWMASCTKLMTAVAALQQVERGNIKLDDDVAKFVPELLKLQVLKDMDGDKPVYEERQRTITLRILLTHTSGLTIPFFNPTLQKWEKATGPLAKDPKTIVEEFSLPLVFQPGTSWMYGTSYDWAGKLVERLTGVTLQEYMKANIWDPLDMQNMTFVPDSYPEVKARKVGMTIKDESGKLGPTTQGYLFITGEQRDDNYGGAGCWGAAESYVKLLQSLCANDGKVLGKETVEELFRPQLDPEVMKDFNALIQTDDTSRRVYCNSFDMSHQVMDHGLGGAISTRDEPGSRKAGTMSWGGLPNLIWWVDRKAGLCGTLFTNLIPVGDLKIVELMREFEKSLYEQYEEFKKQ